MIKLVATLSGAAAAVGFAVIVSPTAQADPFVPCPYDPTVQGAQMQYFNQKTAELKAMQGDVNTRVLGPLSGPERDAWAASPAGLEALAQMRKIVDERDHPPQSCFPLQTVSSAPYFDPEPLQPLPEAPLIVDPAPSVESNVDCTKLRAAYDTLGPVTNTADAAAKLNHLKIPGLSQVTGTSLALCGLDAIPAAIQDPSLENQQRVFDGACGAVDNITNGIIDPCGDTPVG